MRRKLLSTIVLLFFISANGNLLFAWEENSFTYSSQNQKNSISEKKIYEARILHLYIQRYLERIESSVEKYNLNNPSLVAHSYRSINDMLLELEKIMNKDYGEEQAEKIMTNIVKDIKKVNTDFKSYIQQLEKRRSEYLRYSMKWFFLTVINLLKKLLFLRKIWILFVHFLFYDKKIYVLKIFKI